MGRPSDNKGTRLPEDWWPSQQLFHWAMKERPEFDLQELHKLTEDFKDYWLSLAGKQALKVDWNRTYMRWIRNAWQKPGRRPPNKPGGLVL